LIAHVSAILLLPVFEKSVIINDFRAIAHSISARENGNKVCCNAENLITIEVGQTTTVWRIGSLGNTLWRDDKG